MAWRDDFTTWPTESNLMIFTMFWACFCALGEQRKREGDKALVCPFYVIVPDESGVFSRSCQVVKGAFSVAFSSQHSAYLGPWSIGELVRVLIDSKVSCLLASQKSPKNLPLFWLFSVGCYFVIPTRPKRSVWRSGIWFRVLFLFPLGSIIGSRNIYYINKTKQQPSYFFPQWDSVSAVSPVPITSFPSLPDSFLIGITLAVSISFIHEISWKWMGVHGTSFLLSSLMNHPTFFLCLQLIILSHFISSLLFFFPFFLSLIPGGTWYLKR